MKMDLPSWLDAPKIAGLSILCLAFTQYFKKRVPEKYIPYLALVLGVLISIASEIYIGAAFSGTTSWVKAIVNGVIAAIMADLGYSFLSRTPTAFTLPSQTDILKKEVSDEKRVAKDEAKEGGK